MMLCCIFVAEICLVKKKCYGRIEGQGIEIKKDACLQLWLKPIKTSYISSKNSLISYQKELLQPRRVSVGH